MEKKFQLPLHITDLILSAANSVHNLGGSTAVLCKMQAITGMNLSIECASGLKPRRCCTAFQCAGPGFRRKEAINGVRDVGAGGICSMLNRSDRLTVGLVSHEHMVRR
jgi:phosphoribosylformylglycinamidine (FGAM) synthase-like enzyme